MHGRSKDPETDSTSCNTSFKAPQRTDLHHPPAQNMETSRLIDEDGETVDKSANIITVSEVSDHDDITRRGSLHRKSKTEDKTTASDGIQAPCVVPQRKGKVIIHCLRHAQAEHNLRQNRKKDTPDPQLTELGIKQAEYLRKHFEPMGRINYILCSSMRRTIETALTACAPIIQSSRRPGGLQIIAWPKLREIGTGTVNTGTPGIFTSGSFRYEYAIDHYLAIPGWESDDGKQNAKSRVEQVRKDLWQLGQLAMLMPEQGPVAMWKHIQLQPRRSPEDDVEILVVSHANFLKELEENEAYTYYNAMCKTYEFPSEEQVAAGSSPYKMMQISQSKVPFQNESQYKLVN